MTCELYIVLISNIMPLLGNLFSKTKNFGCEKVARPIYTGKVCLKTKSNKKFALILEFTLVSYNS
jgi:hypothetical protein